jgi:hypothetical protein
MIMTVTIPVFNTTKCNCLFLSITLQQEIEIDNCFAMFPDIGSTDRTGH